MIYSKKEFKEKWESGEDGGGLTFEDLADCARDWSLFSRPQTSSILHVRYQILKAAEVSDAEEYKETENA